MRHRLSGRKFGRTSSHRKAMFRNQLIALFTHDRIVTTLAKAKDLRPQAERMVTLARGGDLAARRRAMAMVPDKVVIRRLFEEIAPRFMDRPGGYTRIMRLGRRHGDGAELAIIEFVDYVLQDKSSGSDDSQKKASFMDRAKGMFGAGGGQAEGAADDADSPDSTDEAPKTIEAEAVEVTEEAEAPEADTATEEPEAEAVEAADDSDKAKKDAE